MKRAACDSGPQKRGHVASQVRNTARYIYHVSVYLRVIHHLAVPYQV